MRTSWMKKFEVIRLNLAPDAQLRYPDMNGQWYLATNIDVREERGVWWRGTFNAPTPAQCVGDAYSTFTSGKALLLGDGRQVAWDGRGWVEVEP